MNSNYKFNNLKRASLKDFGLSCVAGAILAVVWMVSHHIGVSHLFH